MRTKKNFMRLLAGLWLVGFASSAFAGEASIQIPDLTQVTFAGLGGLNGVTLLYVGLVVCLFGAAFGLVQYWQTKALPVHSSMAEVSNTIWETCKTYLLQQGKFLLILWVLIAACMVYYFIGLPWHDPENQLSHATLLRNGGVILLASVLGILGSYGVA